MRNALLPTDGLSTVVVATRIDKTVGIPMRGDIRKIVVHMDATPTFSAGSGTVGQMLKKFTVQGNGSHPVYNFEPYGPTVDGEVQAVNQIENKVAVMDEALSSTNRREAKFIFNAQRIRGLWKSMNIKIQTFTPTEIGLTATVQNLNIKILVVYGFCDYSIRLSKDSKNALTMNFDVPSSEGVLMGFSIHGATPNNLTTIEYKDPTGALVNEADFDTGIALQQGSELRTSTGDAQAYMYVETPDVNIDENTKIKVQVSSAENTDIFYWFKSAIQKITSPNIDYRALSYGAVGIGDVEVLSLKSPGEQIAFVQSKPFATVFKGEGKATVSRDNLKERTTE